MGWDVKDFNPMFPIKGKSKKKTRNGYCGQIVC